MSKFAYLVVVLLSPGLAVAGWRLGLRGRGGGGLDETFQLPKKAALPLRLQGAVRPKVKTARYNRSK